jgi:hypothetical protein
MQLYVMLFVDTYFISGMKFRRSLLFVSLRGRSFGEERICVVYARIPFKYHTDPFQDILNKVPSLGRNNTDKYRRADPY